MAAARWDATARQPMDSIKQYLEWFTAWRVIAIAYGVVLLTIYLWPDVEAAKEIALLTVIPAAIGAAVRGLTFWQSARVQIGPSKLKYKTVRRNARLVALACLPFLLVQRLAFAMRE